MLPLLLELTRGWLSEKGLYRYVMVFDQPEFRIIAAGLLSLLIVLLFGRQFIQWLREKKIGDAAQFDVAALEAAMASKANTPTMGGMLIASAIAISTLLIADLSNFYIQMGLIVLFWMAILGGVDDWLKLTASSRPGASRQGLFAWEKFVFQLGLGVLIGWFAFNYAGGENSSRLGHVVNLPLQRTYNDAQGQVSESLIYLGRVGFIILMTLMIAGMSNAVNITDGMDGLATGVSVSVSLGLVLLCAISGWQTAAQYLLVPYVPFSDELAVLISAMAGACLGFLWWNCAPASVFMGDTGSLCLGGLIGYIAVVIRQEFVVLVMSGVLLLEIGSVILQVGWYKTSARLYGEGRRIFRCAPFHWHLHMGGWSEQKIVARLWIVSIVLLGLALATIKLR